MRVTLLPVPSVMRRISESEYRRQSPYYRADYEQEDERRWSLVSHASEHVFGNPQSGVLNAVCAGKSTIREKLKLKVRRTVAMTTVKRSSRRRLGFHLQMSCWMRMRALRKTVVHKEVSQLWSGWSCLAKQK